MRLGNHSEAAAAADLIGRQHTFVLSQLTATLGGNQTHTRTDTEGWSESTTTTRGWHDTATFGRGHEGGLISRAIGHSESISSSTSRNWSVATSWADGTNWSNAESTQRVYDYTVEPTTLQHLPDYALLLAATRSSGMDLTPVECDPAIITLPRVSASPLPQPPHPLAAVTPAQPPDHPVQPASVQRPPEGWQPPTGPHN